MALQVGSAYSEYRIPMDALRRDVAEGKRLIRELAAAAAGGSTTLPQPPRVPVPRTPPRTPANGGDREILARANAEARLAQAAGQAARGEQILSQALAKVDQTSIGAINTQTRLVNIQNRLSDAKGPTVLPRTIDGLSGKAAEAAGNIGKAVQAIGLFGAAGLAVGGAKAAFDFGQAGASAVDARTSFEGLAQQANTTGDALLGRLRVGAQGAVTDTNLIKAANTGLLLTGGKIASDLPKLLEIARASARATGQDVGFVFDSLTRGIARGSPQIIDNAGITLDAAAAFETYAKSIGKAPDQLTKTEQQQATLNAVLAAGQGIINTTGAATDSTAQSFARFSTNIENLTDKAKVFTAQELGPVLDNITKSLNRNDDLERQRSQIASLAKDYAAYKQQIAGLNEGQQGSNQGAKFGADFGALTKEQFDYTKSLTATGVSIDTAVQKAQALTPVFSQIGELQAQINANFDNTQGFDQLTAQIERVAAASPAAATNVSALLTLYNDGKITIDQLNAALNGLEQANTKAAASANSAAGFEAYRRGEIEAGTSAMQTQAQAAQASADAALLDAGAKAQQSLATQILQAQTQLAAESFLALNPNITGSGVASQVAAGNISSAVGQYITMTLATANARAELARLQAQAGVAAARSADVASLTGGGRRVIPAGKAARIADGFDSGLDSPRAIAQANQNVANSKAQATAERELADARRTQTLATGSSASKQAVYNRELAEAKGIYGENSAAYVKAKTALDSFNQSQAKGGGGGAGATKLSDQQRLQNGLLQSQVSFQDKAADAAAKHQQKLADIERDANRKRLDADRQFRESRTSGETSFYRQSGNIQDAGVRQQASAEYQAAIIEAERRGGAAGEAYLKAQTESINQRAQDRDKLASLQSATTSDGQDKTNEQRNKDASEAEYLQGLMRLQEREDAVKLAGVNAQGDAIATARQQQIDEENGRYAEAQDQNSTAAERAADRQITAAERAGKKIDETTLKIRQQGDAYTKVLPGGTPTLGPVQSNTPPAAASAPAQPAAAQRGAEVPQMVDLGVLAAIQEQTGMQSGKFDTLIDRVGRVEAAISRLAQRDGTI